MDSVRELGDPRSNGILRAICQIYIRLMGWRIQGELPTLHKYMLIFWPHTSNWDGLLIIPAAYSLGLRPNIMAKQELFWGPLGPPMRWLGGISVDRNSNHNMVDQMVAAIKKMDRVVLGIAPEGTRSYTPYWKSGFYHIALKTHLPLICIYLDYSHKIAGFSEIIHLSGDQKVDLDAIRQQYKGIKPKHPEKVGEIAFKPR